MGKGTKAESVTGQTNSIVEHKQKHKISFQFELEMDRAGGQIIQET